MKFNPQVLRKAIYVMGLALGTLPLQAGLLPHEWFHGNWTCRIDGRPAKMEWFAGDDTQTTCVGNICTSTAGVKLVGRFSDNGGAWAPLEKISATAKTVSIRYKGADEGPWFLEYDPSGKSANGWTTWKGNRYPFACVDSENAGNPGPRANGSYRLQAKHSGKYLDVTWASMDHNGAVGQAGRSDAVGGGAQIWKLIPAGTGFYRLQVQHSGKFLDVTWASAENGAPVGQAGLSTAAGGGAQLWRLVPALNGWYRLQAKHSGKYLDVTGGNMGTNARVGQSNLSNWRGGAAQLWRFVE